MKKFLFIISMSIVILALVGCSSQNAENDKDEQNKKNQEEVVVATSVAITEILDQLGVKVKGVPNTNYELPDSVRDATKVGNPMSPDMEIIKSLTPTSVICVDTLGSDYEKQFEQNNIEAEFYNLSDVDGLKETILSLGQKFGKKENAEEILNQINKAQSSASKDKKSDQKVLILFGAPGSVMVATDKSYVGNLVKLVVCNNVFSNATSSFTQVNLEEIIKLNPDKILVMTHANPEEAKKSVEEELSKDLWKNINAVKNGDITYLENGYFGMSANLKVVESLEKLGEILYE